MALPNTTDWRYDPNGYLLQAAAVTHTGHVRSRNEDRAFIEAGCFGVSDGMGGVGGGDVAAQEATTQFARSIREHCSPRAAVDDANRKVMSVAQSGKGVLGMGATLCAGVFGLRNEMPSMALINVGDSRAYLARRGEALRLLTRDQRWVQVQVDAGVLTPEEARYHPNRNILTSVVGGVEAYEPSIEFIEPLPGDQYLFCTDGVTEELSDETLNGFVEQAENFELLAQSLVDAVLDGAARDNATIVVVAVLDTPQSPHSPELEKQ
jgi:serine/threonine protein phosphatase PrpC